MSVSLGCGAGCEVEELAYLGPGVVLVAGLMDGVWEDLLGLGDEADQGVEVDGGVAVN